MFFLALATDYDGTIATDGHVPPDVVKALHAFKQSGRRLILVTGRKLEDLQNVFPAFTFFDRIIAENGGVLFEPGTRRELPLAGPPSQSLVEALDTANVQPLSVGRVIIATWEPNEGIVLDCIKRLGIEHQIIFNKGAVMILPPGVNKASGLRVALAELGLSPVNVVGVGDAENDHAFLNLCGCSVAVANALDRLKQAADLTTAAKRGVGVVELLSLIMTKDAELLNVERHGIAIGDNDAGHSVLLPIHSANVLIVGHSGVGKSTIATALTEAMTKQGQQFCLIDPEGDFERLEHAVQAGSATLPPAVEQLGALLQQPTNNLVVNVLAVALDERPAFLTDVLSQVVRLRIRTGRPHWLIVDEAHHVLPKNLSNTGEGLPDQLTGTILITVHPESVARSALAKVRFVAAIGPESGQALTAFCKAVQQTPPEVVAPCQPGTILLWDRQSGQPPSCIRPVAPVQHHRRHTRKYAQGELGPDKSFYFQGPDKKLNLRAGNLMSFLNISDGVDDDTWQYHRIRGDYSAWIRKSIKDERLADQIAVVEQDWNRDVASARDAMHRAIEQAYTAPAGGG